MYRSAGRTALGGTGRHLSDRGRRMLGDKGYPTLGGCWTDARVRDRRLAESWGDHAGLPRPAGRMLRGRTVPGSEPLGSPAWVLLLCWSLAACCTGAMALQPPSITALRMPAELPRPGESVTVSCEALSELPEMTLLYWLENGFFVESLHPDGASLGSAETKASDQQEASGELDACHRRSKT
nr:interleukin-18-binding protein isoform X3 [Zonotrichia albicollis]